MRNCAGSNDDLAGGDAGCVKLAELRETIAGTELTDGFDLRRGEWIDRIVFAPRHVELGVQVLEDQLDFIDLALTRQPQHARIALEPIDERLRELWPDDGVDVVKARDHDDRRRHRVRARAQAVEGLLESRDCLAIGNGLFDLNDHERGGLELELDVREVLDRAQRIFRLVARREPAEQLAIVRVEGFAAQIFDDAALQRGVTTREEEERVQHVGFEVFGSLGAQDAIDHRSNYGDQLVVSQLGVAKLASEATEEQILRILCCQPRPRHRSQF